MKYHDMVYRIPGFYRDLKPMPGAIEAFEVPSSANHGLTTLSQTWVMPFSVAMDCKVLSFLSQGELSKSPNDMEIAQEWNQ